jgi:hypothetical protein
MVMKRYLILSITALIFAGLMNAQEAAHNKLKLFVDCGQARCDFDFIRQQITICDFVRDRRESDIHILIISQQAGTGGLKYDVQFIGQGSWATQQDTLFFFTSMSSTQYDIRQQLVQAIKAGVTMYLAKMGQLDKLNISFAADSSIQNSSVLNIDKWNSWVLRVGGRANFSGDKNYKEKGISANASASRVTDRSKLEFFFYNSTSQNAYTFMENETKTILKTRNDYKEAEQSYVKTISRKWSWAFQSAFRKSSYDNLENAVSAEAGMEYNIFPYKSSSTKFLALRFMMEIEKRNYLEETVFDKTKETLLSNDLGIYASFMQPWGSISSNITWYNYIHDFSKNNLSMQANVEVNLFKGVSINFFGYASLINDQLNLSKAGASSEEILLRLKALSTSFNYYTGMGINYRFGSKFNNCVNPRFTNGRH